jgi:hypothetical protein
MHQGQAFEHARRRNKRIVGGTKQCPQFVKRVRARVLSRSPMWVANVSNAIAISVVRFTSAFQSGSWRLHANPTACLRRHMHPKKLTTLACTLVAACMGLVGIAINEGRSRM